jgi:hypothetical protein
MHVEVTVFEVFDLLAGTRCRLVSNFWNSILYT